MRLIVILLPSTLVVFRGGLLALGIWDMFVVALGTIVELGVTVMLVTFRVGELVEFPGRKEILAIVPNHWL